MRRRRDPFGRETHLPQRNTDASCAWCGAVDPRRPASIPLGANVERRIYDLTTETDGGRWTKWSRSYCSWSCAEAYHGGTIGR